MQPAARIGDMHLCPDRNPGKAKIPHVGGPVVSSVAMNVLIGGQPAATVGSMCTCVGPPDSIVGGSTKVVICGSPAARLGDPCAHGGRVVQGCPQVLIG